MSDFLWVCYGVFILSIVFKFRLTYVNDGETIPTRDVGLIATKYLKNEFVLDLIPMIPFEHLLDLGGKEKHLYFIKIIRLYNCSKILNSKYITAYVMKVYNNHLERRIERDDKYGDGKLGENKDLDLVKLT